jgi:hypothetical protein
MTQTMLAFDAPRTQTATDRVERLLRSRAGQEVSALELAQVGGFLAWRTEVSRCRTQRGMPNITPRLVRDARGKVIESLYRWVP